jgi:hypothetical protein
VTVLSNGEPTILQESGPDVLTSFVPFFVTMLRRLCLDNSRGVREELLLLLGDALALDKKQFTPGVMKGLIGHWWMCTGDPCPEVATAAVAAFESAIPPKKRESVLLFLSSSIAQQAATYMQSTVQSLSQAEAMYQVCYDASIHATNCVHLAGEPDTYYSCVLFVVPSCV